MGRRTTTLAAALLLCGAGSFACGGSKQPAQDVREAHTELTSARQEGQAALRDLEARHSQQRVEAQRAGKSPEELSELYAKQQRERADLLARKQSDIADKAEELSEKDQKLLSQQKEARAELDKRLSEIDAKASELRAKSASFDPVKRSEFDRLWFQYTSEHRDVEGALRSLDAAPTSEWSTWRERTEVQLEELERAVEKLDDVD